ncbi:Protein ECERIFERUM 1 [Morella rubra]|uniref:Protein ECERIFERUM 1 n=1 Tax=Morella rubra TaxID=262757 RepID=A0A6A1WG70_9ROSI|nr:Protein ECERIFERUM 1 [Morella rubra]
MASKPGILTDWPRKPLGSFKYIILAPWVIHSTYSFVTKDKSERDFVYFSIFPFLLWRMLHSQIWISLSRYWTGKFKNFKASNSTKLTEKESLGRSNTAEWNTILSRIRNQGIWNVTSALVQDRWDTNDSSNTCGSGGVPLLLVSQSASPPLPLLSLSFSPSFLNCHRAYNLPTIMSDFFMAAVIHPFAEHIVYFMLFAIPTVATLLTGTASIVSLFGYVTYIDFMNFLGHCNCELIPKWVFSLFPPLKYLMYTPSFHSLHHTQFRTNYSLFMPLYDYIYGTMDKSTDELYETSLKREAESSLDVVHLTHLTTPESIYHLRLGFASLASRPLTSNWYLWLIWPVTLWSMMVTWLYGRTFVVERHRYSKLRLQTWAIPKYSIQYFLQRQKESISSLIEDAILDAEERGAKGEEINRYGEVYVERNPTLNVKIVDGSSLAVAVVLNSIPKGTTQVVLTGKLTKVAYALAFTLCQRGIQVVTLHEHEYLKLKKWLKNESESNLVLSRNYAQKIWLVGDGLYKKEQQKAQKGTLFIPFSQLPPKQFRKDCSYHSMPAMVIPKSLENLHSCENWLPRRVMSAWRIAAIVHALEGWNEHECGLYTMSDVEKVWQASLGHGFQPLVFPTQSKYN